MPLQQLAGETFKPNPQLIVGSIFRANAALRDLANKAFAFYLSSLLCFCISVVLLMGRIPLSSMGMYHSSLVCPLAAAFASLSTRSFPCTPLCPGTHHILLSFAGWLAYKPSICLWSALTRYCPEIIVSFHIVWISAWLSNPIIKATPLLSYISLAPISAPSSSASNTMCSSCVPRYSLTA